MFQRAVEGGERREGWCTTIYVDLHVPMHVPLCVVVLYALLLYYHLTTRRWKVVGASIYRVGVVVS
jgi:hypothetical protein